MDLRNSFETFLRQFWKHVDSFLHYLVLERVQGARFLTLCSILQIPSQSECLVFVSTIISSCARVDRLLQLSPAEMKKIGNPGIELFDYFSGGFVSSKS